MKTLGATPYAEAAADPRARQIGPDVVMRPFHQPFPNLGQLWHVYCEKHPDFGHCGVEGAAAQVALEHGNKHERGSSRED